MDKKDMNIKAVRLAASAFAALSAKERILFLRYISARFDARIPSPK
jgi:hypothetical protein